METTMANMCVCMYVCFCEDRSEFWALWGHFVQFEASDLVLGGYELDQVATPQNYVAVQKTAKTFQRCGRNKHIYNLLLFSLYS